MAGGRKNSRSKSGSKSSERFEKRESRDLDKERVDRADRDREIVKDKDRDRDRDRDRDTKKKRSYSRSRSNEKRGSNNGGRYERFRRSRSPRMRYRRKTSRDNSVENKNNGKLLSV